MDVTWTAQIIMAIFLRLWFGRQGFLFLAPSLYKAHNPPDDQCDGSKDNYQYWKIQDDQTDGEISQRLQSIDKRLQRLFGYSTWLPSGDGDGLHGSVGDQLNADGSKRSCLLVILHLTLDQLDLLAHGH